MELCIKGQIPENGRRFVTDLGGEETWYYSGDTIIKILNKSDGKRFGFDNVHTDTVWKYIDIEDEINMLQDRINELRENKSMKHKKIITTILALGLLFTSIFTGVSFCEISTKSNYKTIKELNKKIDDLEERIEQLESIIFDKDFDEDDYDIDEDLIGRITLKEFNSIDIGDTYKQVVKEVGFKGKITYEHSYHIGDKRITSKAMEYEGNGEEYISYAEISFKNNIVVEKYQYGLE